MTLTPYVYNKNMGGIFGSSLANDGLVGMAAILEKKCWVTGNFSGRTFSKYE